MCALQQALAVMLVAVHLSHPAYVVMVPILLSRVATMFKCKVDQPLVEQCTCREVPGAPVAVR